MRELCPWYALTVKHHHEGAARSALEIQGFEALAPSMFDRFEPGFEVGHDADGFAGLAGDAIGDVAGFFTRAAAKLRVVTETH